MLILVKKSYLLPDPREPVVLIRKQTKPKQMNLGKLDPGTSRTQAPLDLATNMGPSLAIVPIS